MPKRLLRLALLAALVLYAGILATLFFAQRSLLYPGAGRSGPTTAAAAGLDGFQDLTLATDDGERLVAWWKPPQPGKALIVYFFGNGGALLSRRDRARLLTEDGRGLLMIAYRGYSGSTGFPTEEGLRIDARIAYAQAVSVVEPRRIVLYGESLGTGVAVRLASEREVGGVILDAPYTSTADVASGRFWFVPIPLLMHDQFRSIDIVGGIKAPLLFMHGAADRVVPFAFGERLFAASPEPKQFLRLAGVGHARVLESGGLAAVRAFLDRIETGLPRAAAAAGAAP